MSLSLPCHIEACNSHRPFAFSCVTTYLFPTSFPMHNTHHPLPFFIILTTQVPPTNSPYQFPILCANLRPQPYIFPIPINMHIWDLSPSITPTPTVVHDPTPQPTLISQPWTQFPPITSYISRKPPLLQLCFQLLFNYKHSRKLHI
jgi:hypothetical protein